MGNFLESAKDTLRDFNANSSAYIVDNAPTIAITVGIIAGIGATVWACKKTLKLPEIIEEQKEELETIKDIIPKEEKKDYVKAVSGNYAMTGLRVAKLYSGPVIIGILACSAIVAGTNELKARNAALTATVGTLETMYSRYRANVVERYGEEVDRELRYGIKHEKVKVKEKDPETGKTKTVTKDILTVDKDAINNGDYARIFEKGVTTYYTDSPEYNMMLLRDTERNMNRMLKNRGYLFLNEVYEALGYAPTEAGRCVGWLYDPKHEVVTEGKKPSNQVSFGIDLQKCPEAREFCNGFQPFLILDFNVDGDISKNGLYLKANKLTR